MIDSSVVTVALKSHAKAMRNSKHGNRSFMMQKKLTAVT